MTVQTAQIFLFPKYYKCCFDIFLFFETHIHMHFKCESICTDYIYLGNALQRLLRGESTTFHLFFFFWTAAFNIENQLIRETLCSLQTNRIRPPIYLFPIRICFKSLSEIYFLLLAFSSFS